MRTDGTAKVGGNGLTQAVGDVPGNESTTVTLVPGTPVSGDISAPTATSVDEDWFKVDLVAGQTYYFALNGTGGNALADGLLTLYYNNSGAYLSQSATDNDGGVGNNAFLTYTAQATGTYYIAASGFAWSSGHYTLSSGTIAADTIPADLTTTQTLVLGKSVDGLATGSDDIDSYAITLTAGMTYDFSLAGKIVNGVNALDYGYFNVANDSGQAVAAGYFTPGEGSAHVYYTAGETGTYYLQAGSFTYSGTYPSPHTNGGGYTVGFTTAPADIDAGGPVHLTAGETISSLISSQTDTDTFQVDLAAGQTISVYMIADGADPTATVSLQMNGRSDSADTYYGGGANLIFRASTAGTYNIVAGGFHGTYTLGVENVPADLSADNHTTGVLTIDQTLHGQIETTDDKDWYKISLTAGKTYVFTMEDLFGKALMPQLSLLQANGTVLLTSADTSTTSQPAQLVFTATATGTYYLQTSLGLAWPYGEYALNAHIATDSVGQTEATSKALALGQVVTGQIDFGGDQDWFSMNVVAGQTYSLDVLSTGADAPNYLEYVGLALVSGDYYQVVNTGTWDHTDQAHLRFTATATGRVTFAVNNNYADTGAYTLRTGLFDTVSNWVDTSARLTLGQVQKGTIDYLNGGLSGEAGDSDWYAVTLQAGKDYVFTANGSGALPTDAYLYLRDVNGNPVYSAVGGYHQIQFHATQGGTYYVAVGTSDYKTGEYTVTAAQTTDIFDQSNTVTSLAIGGTIHSNIGSATDHDWIKVNLVAGQSYMFTVTPEGGARLGNASISVLGTDNNIVVSSTEGPGAHDAALRFTAITSGTYYLDVSGVSGATGSYAVSAQAVARQNLADAVEGTPLANHTISIYFATNGQSFDGHTATSGWTSANISSFLAAAGKWSDVADVHFVQTANAAAATLVVVLDSTAGEYVPTDNGIAVFNGIGAAGSDLYGQWMTAIGHTLGLVDPSVWGAGHEPFETTYGTFSAFNDPGYTVMSTSSGNYAANPAGPMVLDVAAVQAMYGAVAHNAGNTVYTLSQNGFTTIWDTGGNDTIAFSAGGFGTIDLRASSLTRDDQGQFISYNANNINSVVTIAHGVIIENATGGVLGDTLYGNAASNILSGGAGDDILWGGLGNDRLLGGDGTDTADFYYATTGITLNLNLTAAQNTGEGSDTFSSIEAVRGSAFNDRITASATTTYVDGGAGTDTLVLTGSFADYTYAPYYYQGTLTGHGGTISMDRIETIQFADRTLSYDQVAGVQVAIKGDLNGEIFQGGTYVLTTADLDFDHTGRSSVIYTVDSTTNGAVYVNGVVGTTFTSTQLEAGLVSFMQLGSTSLSANFTVHAVDGELLNGASYTYILQFAVARRANDIGDNANNTINGTSGDDIIYGNGGNDILHGGAGYDYLHGGDGNDILYGDADGGSYDGGAGFDTVNFSNLAAGLTVNLDYMMLDIEKVVGTAFNDVITYYFSGAYADNVIDGGAGADQMAAGDGDDTYYIDNIGDTVSEEAYQGIDLIIASATHKLEANVENLTLTGSANINGTGNNSHNTILGNSGNNKLDGGAGADILIGGLGNDTYYVDNTGDQVVELNGQGTDTVFATINYTAAANVENLTLSGTANINATGNALANVLSGNSGNNVLNGGLGVDTMLGGAGNDTYYVDSFYDVVTELKNEGTDTVISSVQYIMGGSYVENATLTGTLNSYAVGNALDNILFGNSGNNNLTGGAGNDRLDGGAGADGLRGGVGNDIYYVDNLGDFIVEANDEGTDLVYSTVSFNLGAQYIENLTLRGSDNINGLGNALANVITGNAGNNLIDGRQGNDKLTGGAGADIFFFGAGSGKDTVTDFSASQNDSLNLHAYSQATAVITQVGNDTVIDLGGGNVITLTGSLKADVTSHITW